MRIGLNAPHPPEISTDRTPTSATSTQSASGAQPVDKFSGDSVSLNSLAARALQLPDVRQDRIDSLRQQLASGEYQVEPQKVAAAMMND
ncbi:MAG: flagellar biosynthesis anti-sigma factor FlgM [Terriglobales bacterium]